MDNGWKGTNKCIKTCMYYVVVVWSYGVGLCVPIKFQLIESNKFPEEKKDRRNYLKALSNACCSIASKFV